jgi:hypothetical protein
MREPGPALPHGLREESVKKTQGHRATRPYNPRSRAVLVLSLAKMPLSKKVCMNPSCIHAWHSRYLDMQGLLYISDGH